ncbi:MAG: Ppx/GppA family phosphatase [Hyphomicrobiales bacterium]|uniref:Ppx/GppA phosphatase family protein n=1 Tax=Rhabdaerophilum calidifontis TaxID=2604328 RepID=UPI00123AEEB5|nr:Ppx/GppA phosphatase family protein [Rhabdaerophilum calidifontis]MCA1952174.1 Ppx/GppA family phosphatase [Hyphomicrobiales bacterium]MCA1999402.1 Ppx/GppA family phosphatase [Hyphomicrobiales bacterium]
MPPFSLTQGPVAVIDIGSNSVRLVTYDRLTRAPVPMFNEKSLCGLGRQVAVTGLLPRDGIAEAREALKRFRVLCDLMRVEKTFVLATAAARRAANGPDFIAEVEAILGEKVAVLTGNEEARLAALGVVAGLYRPNGLVGDLGGGSLELIDVEDGGLGQGTSLELGGLALRDASGKSMKRAARIIADALDGVPGLARARGRDIIAIGGTWRAVARLHMAKTGYPLNVLHGYSVPARAIAEFCRDIQKVDLDQLPAIGEIARERRPLLPYGAAVLEQVILRSEAARFVISTSGVREGVLYSQLPQVAQAQDPLLVGARALSDLHARAPDHADELIAWTDAFAASGFPQESPEERRIRHAACLVSEVAWRANPDYRAEEAARVVAYAALPALDHRERAFLASVQHARYEGLTENTEPPLRALLGLAEIDRARALGCLLRVAYNISAGQVGALPHAPLRASGGRLVQTLPQHLANLSNERLAGRLKQAARMFGLGFEVRIAG